MKNITKEKTGKTVGNCLVRGIYGPGKKGCLAVFVHGGKQVDVTTWPRRGMKKADLLKKHGTGLKTYKICR